MVIFLLCVIGLLLAAIAIGLWALRERMGLCVDFNERGGGPGVGRGLSAAERPRKRGKRACDESRKTILLAGEIEESSKSRGTCWV